MAKPKKNDAEALKENEKAETANNGDEQHTLPEDETKPDDGAVIRPVAFEIKLKSIHPHTTYGRCGYRFNKETAVEIPFEALTGEQITTLADDPYLELVPVTEA